MLCTIALSKSDSPPFYLDTLQVEGLFAELHEAFVGMTARMEVFQSQFAILVEDHRLAAQALDKAPSGQQEPQHI